MARIIFPGARTLGQFVSGGPSGLCGEDATLMLLGVQRGTPVDGAHLLAIWHYAQVHGWAGSAGQETLAAIGRYLDALRQPHWGWSYAEPFRSGWQQLLADCIRRGVPAIVQLARAGVLPGDEPAVRYHFITLLGGDAEAGYGLFGDGDNPASRAGRLVSYSWDDLARAGICGVLVAGIAPAATGEGAPMMTASVPAGWTDDGKNLTAPNGVPVVLGFRQFVLAHAWPADNVPLALEAHVEPVEAADGAREAGQRQLFTLGALGWTQTRGVFVCRVGADLQAAEQTISALSGALSAAQALPPAGMTPDEARALADVAAQLDNCRAALAALVPAATVAVTSPPPAAHN